MSTLPADVLALQITAPDATLGTVPLAEGIRLIEGGKELLLAAACRQHQMQTYYPRLGYKEAPRSWRHASLARPNAAASSPPSWPPSRHRSIGRPRLFPADDQQLALETEPFARRSTLPPDAGLGPHPRLDPHGKLRLDLTGVDRRQRHLCEAIASMKPGGDQVHLQIRMSWLRNRPRVPAGIPPKVAFSQTAFSIIQEAGRKFGEVPRRSHAGRGPRD